MTVETTARKQSYAGGQSALAFTFRALVDHPEDIKVVAVSSGIETLLTYTSQYAVTISTDGIGGTVIVSPSFSTNYTYTVYRETTNKQESDYDDYNQFPADTLEEDIDRRTLVAQELEEAITRSILLPVSSTISSLTLPNPAAGKALKWNAAEDALVNTTVDIESAITEASNYATTASTQAAAASASATLAGNYATTASTGLSEIVNYTSTASSAAVLAGVYAVTASTAANSAALSETAAATSATLAGLYASTASTQAALSGNYASTASTQAALAGNYATTASTQAALAGNYATTASTAAVLAGNYATSASTAAIAAATSATTAASFVPAVSGNSLKLLRVKSDETGLEWSVAPTSSAGVAGALSVFYNSTVTSGSMVVTYATTAFPYLHGVHVCDSNGTLVIPDSLVFAPTGVTITMSSYLPIAGTWGTLVL